MCTWGHSVISISIGTDGGRWEKHGSEGCHVREPANGDLAQDRCPRSPKTLESRINGKEKLADALAVVTQAQGKRQQCEEKQAQQRELESGASSTGVENDEWMSAIDEKLFEGGQSRVWKTRSQKQMERQAHARATAVAEEPLEPGGEIRLAAHSLEIAADEMKTLQAAGATLNAVREAADGHSCSAGIGFFRRDGLLFCRWTPPGRDKQDMSVEQLVLPVQCRRMVLQVAHDIPMSGHLGKEKTVQRVLQRFYWPTLYHDVVEYCRT